MAERSGGSMNALRKMVQAVGLKAAQWASGETVSTTDPRLGKFFGGETYTGKTVNEATAMQISVVWACVRILSESVGQLPWGVYEKQKNGNSAKVDDHPLNTILNYSPNADMTHVEFREAIQTNLGLQGNGYCFREVNGAGEVSSLYPIPSSMVKPMRSKTTGDITYDVLERGKWINYPREKIWHIKGFGSNGLVGYSPIGCMRQAMAVALATEEFQARFFGQGARPSAILKIDKWLDDNQRKKARENVNDMVGGLENAHKVALLEGGMDLQTWGLPLDDLQFVELRRFSLHEICRIYGIPPHRVADLEKASFNNIEQLSLEFVMFTLLPWLRRWEESANRWLLKPGQQERFTVRFNFDGLLRADSQARAEFLRTMVANGVMSRNEARAKENLNRVEGGGMDDYTVQSNMATIDMLEQIVSGAKSGDTHFNIAPPALNMGGLNIKMPDQAAPVLNLGGLRVDAPVNATLREKGDNMEVEHLLKDLGPALALELRRGFSQLQEAAGRPRKAIFDKDGNPIGTVPVDSLEVQS